MMQVALMVVVGPSNEPNGKLLAPSFDPIIIIRHLSSIMVCNLGDQCVILNGDADFVQHFNLRQEQFMIPLKCHVPSLIEFIEFFFDIHDCAAELTILLESMDEQPDDHQQRYTVWQF